MQQTEQRCIDSGNSVVGVANDRGDQRFCLQMSSSQGDKKGKRQESRMLARLACFMFTEDPIILDLSAPELWQRLFGEALHDALKRTKLRISITTAMRGVCREPNLEVLQPS
jgi:hypothetical protein